MLPFSFISTLLLFHPFFYFCWHLKFDWLVSWIWLYEKVMCKTRQLLLHFLLLSHCFLLFFKLFNVNSFIICNYLLTYGPAESFFCDGASWDLLFCQLGLGNLGFMSTSHIVLIRCEGCCILGTLSAFHSRFKEGYYKTVIGLKGDTIILKNERSETNLP